jgi:hypothetical protein
MAAIKRDSGSGAHKSDVMLCETIIDYYALIPRLSLVLPCPGDGHRLWASSPKLVSGFIRDQEGL